MTSRAETKRLAHEANRARSNYQLRAIGIAELTISGADHITEAQQVLTTPEAADFLARLQATIADTRAAMAEAQQAEEQWLAAILPTIDDKEVTP